MKRSFSLAGTLGVVAMASVAQPVLLGLGAQPLQRANAVQSQSQGKDGPGDHRFRYLGAGAAIGGLLALGYYQISDQGKLSGRCQPLNCALPYLSITGALSGLFIAREKYAQRRAEAPRSGEALEFRFSEFPLPAAAASLSVRDSFVVAATDSGAQVFTTGARSGALRRRGAGLSNLRSVAIGGADARLFIGTGSALWETALTSGVVSRVLEGPVDALSAHGEVVVAASGNSVRVRRLVDGALRIDSVNAGVPVTSTRFDATSGKWWVTSDSVLFELAVANDASKPVLTQRAAFLGQARAVASSANWVAVALGSDGIAVWPRISLTGSGVTSPVLLRGELRFAFDVAFVGDDLFVASGVDGVTRVDLSAGARIVGSSRQAGYATTIESSNGVLFVGDRDKNRVMRIVP